MKKWAVEEPKPTGQGRPVTSELVEHLRQNYGNFLEIPEILNALEDRSRMGEMKYGTVLREHNGRDCVNDLEQELLDALQYLQQAKMEQRKIPRRLRLELKMLLELLEN